MYERKTELETLLRQFGVGEHYSGYKLCISAVEIALEHPESLNSITKCIYPELADFHHTSLKCVERNLRTMIEKIWKSGGREFFCGPDSDNQKRPSNSRFIEMLVQVLKSETPITEKNLCEFCAVTAHYKDRIAQMESEAVKQQETIDWMHDMIWDLLGEKKKYLAEIEELQKQQKQSNDK